MKNKNSKFRNFAYKKNNSLSNENHWKSPKTSHKLTTTMFQKMEIMKCQSSIFMRLQKEQKMDNKQKISQILRKNAFEDVKSCFAAQKCSTAFFFELR